MERAESDAHSNNARAKVIAFDDLCRADRISVQTKNSNYQFSVLDPSERKGMLTGGLLGDEIMEAVLNGTMSEHHVDFDSRELKTGARAVFFIETKNHVRRLITSVITDIALVKDSVGGKRAA
jgi:hypothetical protein